MSIENLKKILESERYYGAKLHSETEGNNGNDAISYEAGSKDMENRLLPLLQKAVEMAEFYSSASIGFKKESKELFEYGDDNKPAQFGKKAREFLLSLSETTESVSEFTKMTDIKKEGE